MIQHVIKNKDSQKIRLSSLLFFLTLENKKQVYRFLFMILSISLLSGLTAGLPILFAIGIDTFSSVNGASLSVFYITSFALSLLVTSVLTELEWLMFGPFNLTLTRQFTTHVFNHALSLPYSILQRYTSYQIARIVQEGLDAVNDMSKNITFFIAPTLIELTVAISIISYILSPWMAFVLISAIMGYGYVANYSAGKIKRSTATAAENNLKVWDYSLDAIANSPLIQQGNLRSTVTEKLNRLLVRNEEEWYLTFYQRAIYGVLQAVIFGSVVVLILWSSATDVVKGTLSIGELVLINTYIIRLLKPAEILAGLYQDVYASAGRATLLLHLLRENPLDESSSSQECEALTKQPFSLTLNNLHIVVNGKSLIEELFLCIPENTRLFIVGPSGVGKSTLLRVLSTLVPPDHGHYLVNGFEVTPSHSQALKRHIAVAQQECFLLNTTIEENISLGGHISHKELEYMIDALGLYELSEYGHYDREKTVGERGNRLSGGEKKRISLARALLSRPKLLLLDEPTSALDEVTRARVLKILDSRRGEATEVIVTHDLLMIQPHDSVLFLGGPGKILYGTSQELRMTSALYKDFCCGSEETFLKEKIA